MLRLQISTMSAGQVAAGSRLGGLLVHAKQAARQRRLSPHSAAKTLVRRASARSFQTKFWCATCIRTTCSRCLPMTFVAYCTI